MRRIFNALLKEIEIPHFPYYILVKVKTNEIITNAPNPIPDQTSGKNEQLITLIKGWM